MAIGDKAAIDRARQSAREDWEEIDRYYKSELMYGLPDTYNEFIKKFRESKDSFEQSEEMFYDLSEAFEACYECGSPAPSASLRTGRPGCFVNAGSGMQDRAACAAALL